MRENNAESVRENNAEIPPNLRYTIERMTEMVDRFTARIYFIVQNRRCGFPKSAINRPRNVILTGFSKFVEGQ